VVKCLTKKVFDGAISLNPSRFKFSMTINTNNIPNFSNTSRVALQVSWDTSDTINDFSSDDDTGFENNHTHGVTLFSNAKVVGLSTYINMVNETCSNAAQSQVPVYRTIIYQDSTSLSTEKLPDGDPDSTITLSTRVSFFSFLTDCPQPTILWDPEIGTNGAASLGSLFLMVLMFLVYL